MRTIFGLPASHPWQLLIGLALWTVWFIVVYGGVSLACSAVSPAADQGPMRWIHVALVGFTLAVAGVQGVAAVACARRAGRIDRGADDGLRAFIATAATALHAVAAASTLFVGIPLLFMWTCV